MLAHPAQQTVQDADESLKLLKLFSLMPARFKDAELVIVFAAPKKFCPLAARNCDILGAKPGAAVAASQQIGAAGVYRILAEDDVALALVEIPEGTPVKARVATVFGIRRDTEYTADGVHTTPEVLTALRVKEILEIGQRQE